MRRNALQENSPIDVSIPFLILAGFLAYTAVFLFSTPYSGFYFNPTGGEILQVFVEAKTSPTLEAGDFIRKAGDVTLEQYSKDIHLVFFKNVQPGQAVPILVERNGAQIEVSWILPGFNQAEFSNRFFNIWWLGYIFWFFGAVVQLFIRPRDERWWLLVALYYVTGFWLLAGAFSSLRVAYSTSLFHATTWILLPIYLHFHWVFPQPLGQGNRWARFAFYLGSIGLAICELLRLLPRGLYLISFMFTLAGSITLIILHYLRQPELRRDLGFLMNAFLAALLPPILFSLFIFFGSEPQAGPLALLTLPIMPAAYFYIVSRRQLGGQELRANRIIAAYAFLTLLGTTLLIITGFISPMEISHEALVFFIVFVSAVSSLVSILVFPAFQAFIERRVLGIKLPTQNISETYSARIITSADLPSLLNLLEEEVFPSLMIRQYAFIRLANGSGSTLLSKAATSSQVQEEALEGFAASIATVGLFPLSHAHQPLGWVRLILPLKVGDDLIGLWLLGRRDPDDLYPQAEVPSLQSLANQTAIALSNMLQTERLRKLYEEDVERYENSRMQLALDLHDSVLNQLAVLRLGVDEMHVGPNFETAYNEVAQRLREIVSNLRPPMLSYGLKLALQEQADNLMERSKDTINIRVKLNGDERYPAKIEQHLFRIAQEACENAIRHGHAESILVSGQLTPEMVELKIDDDGSGFKMGPNFQMDELLANRHFGLAGMAERSTLIGAQVRIASAPNAGTRIHILWKAKQE